VKSHIDYQIMQTAFKGLGNSEQCVQGYVFLASFYLPDELVAQIRLFRQLFLAQASLLSVIADILAHGSTIRKRHSLYAIKKDDSAKPDICAIF
jgi:hypothetical protein